MQAARLIRTAGRRLAAIPAALTCGHLVSRLSLWATAEPLDELRRQVVHGAAPPGGWTFDRLIVDAAAAALVAAGGVLVTLMMLNATGVLLASVLRAFDAFAIRVTPRWLRRMTLAVCGVALTATTVAATAATAEVASGGSAAEHPHRSPVSGLPLPDLPTSAPETVVTVSAGDSLWSIARSCLSANASEAAVAARAARLYAENRRVIGDDPNLIFPGQKLTAPGGAT
jgi:hypothetical protein